MAERRTSSRSFLNIAAPELLAEIRSKIRRKKMLAELQAVEWKKLPDEILAAVIALLSDSGKTDGRDGHDQTH
jgi:Arc/MetJ family transcription regulator